MRTSSTTTSNSYLRTTSAISIVKTAAAAAAVVGVLSGAPLLASAAPSSAGVATERHDGAAMPFVDAVGNMIWPTNKNNKQEVFSLPALGRPDFGKIKSVVTGPLKHLEDELKHKFESWLHAGQVVVDGIAYNKLVHPSFPNYALRITAKKEQQLSASGNKKKRPEQQFCSDDVYSMSGYLDVDGKDGSASRHLFFAFYEARKNPESAPLISWLNGGPGCSSTTGLLFELGPCSIVNATSTQYNRYSWNNEANIVFLDQPASGVGYSYSDDGSVINNTPEAAKDYYAFLQLFLQHFPKYSKAPLHIAAESYGGIYAPTFANYAHTQNKALEASKASEELLAEYTTTTSSESTLKPIHVNLASVMIGNGLTRPDIQFPSVVDYACGKENKYRMFDPESQTCKSMASKAGTCKSLIEQCYKYDSSLTCTPAALYCWSSMYQPMQQTGLNLYDVRKTCDRSPDKDGPLCYKAMEDVEKFMNIPEIKEELGVPASIEFKSCNMQVNQAFLLHGDSMHNYATLIEPLVDDGIRYLIYNGVADAMCNWIGDYGMVNNLNTVYSKEWASAPEQTWTVDGKKAGMVRSVSKASSSSKSKKAFGNLAWVSIANAGHMVPADQPENALDLVNKWLKNEPLDVKK